jgi:hypothetical protein
LEGRNKMLTDDKENLNESTKTLELIIDYIKVYGCKVNTKKLYTNHEHIEFENKNTVSFTLASNCKTKQRIK